MTRGLRDHWQSPSGQQRRWQPLTISISHRLTPRTNRARASRECNDTRLDMWPTILTKERSLVCKVLKFSILPLAIHWHSEPSLSPDGRRKARRWEKTSSNL
ncbi:uncharacterized protein LOC112552295 [Pogonomyrmex barbatus]|uniref:Uncharacterized protein LOC112552295 n=1 Tax=Pogonomyrmex barbatus TaxID=144034 RepID=A0A8N1S2H4_9HYME|nr:uncharacterized protein LOC112552295 [Pogonomyrmex barbatus]